MFTERELFIIKHKMLNDIKYIEHSIKRDMIPTEELKKEWQDRLVEYKTISDKIDVPVER